MKITGGRKGAGKVVRHKKKYWRKGAAVTEEVEKYNEAKKEEFLRSGLAQKKNEELFVIQKTADHVPTGKTRGVWTESIIDNLKCFANLKPNDLIPVAKVSERRRPKVAIGRASKGGKKRKMDAAKKREVEEEPSSSEDAAYDLWGSGPKVVKTKKLAGEECLSGVDPTAVEYTMRVFGRRQVNIPKTLTPSKKKVTALPSVQVTHPGASYNPSFEEHQELLRQAHEVELSKVQSQQTLEKKLYVPLDQLATPESSLQEMSAGLFDAEQGESESEGETATEQAEDDLTRPRKRSPPTAENSRKTRADRARDRKMAADKKKKELEKKERMRINEIYSARSISKKLKTAEAAIESRRLKRHIRKSERLSQGAGHLSRFRFQEPDKDLLLTEELPGSLRLLKPEGSILEDRYKSLQKRNIIETRVRQKKTRKFKKKKVPKRSFMAA